MTAAPLHGPSASACWQIPAGAASEWATLSAVLDGLFPAVPACELEPALWWSKVASDVEAAKARCGACPALGACAAYAVAAREPEGVWGGMSRADRVAMGEARRVR